MKQRDILFLSISVFIVIFFWVGFSVVHNLDTSTVSAPLEENIEPISPSFDTKTIDAIKNKSNISPIFETQISGSSSAEPLIEINEDQTQSSSSAEGVTIL